MIIFDQDFLNLVYELVNIDKYLTYFATNYSTYCYFILFLIIFCETGLVVMPFLPGDSLLFVAGTISANGQLNIIYVTIAIFFGALCGDSCNFNIGKYFGRRLFNSSNSKIFKQKYLIYAEDFYAKHGYKMIIVARFVPILRTFSPFVAGMSAMSYIKFILCSMIGVSIWIMGCLFTGYIFGNIDIVKQNISLVFIALIILPIMISIIVSIIKKTKK